MDKLKMKPMKKFCLFIIVIGSLAGNACNKKEPVISIDPRLKQYFSYQPGTYWVYYDSVKNVEDSFSLEYKKTEFIKDISGTYEDETSHLFLYEQGQFIDNMYADLVLHYTGLTVRYYSPSTFERPLYSMPLNTGFLVLNDYQLNGTLFDSVSMAISTNVLGINNDTFVVSPNTGIIKMSIHHSKDAINSPVNYRWSLVRWKIIR
jgi:hypothetical protein